MGDDYYRLAVVAHTAKHGKKLLCLLRGKHRSRLVKNKYIRSAVQHLYYLDRLLFRNRHFIYFFIRVYVEAVFFAYFLNPRRYLFNIVASFFLKTEHYVFRRGKHVYKLKVLVYHTDLIVKRVLRGAYNRLHAVYKYLPLVRIIYSRKHIHKRGLAAAVFT